MLRTNTLAQQYEEWQRLVERAQHSDMRPLSPLESQWLDDYEQAFGSYEMPSPWDHIDGTD